jgi:cell division protease FtsH
VRRKRLPLKYLFAAAAVVVALAAIFWLRQLTLVAEPPYIPISEVLNRAERGEVVSATITGNVVVITTRDKSRYRSIKEPGSAISEQLRQHGVEVAVQSSDPAPAATPLMALLPLVFIGAMVWLLMRQGGASSRAMSFGRSHARMVTPDRPAVTFEDVAGVEEAKQELQEIVEFLKNPQRFRALGARVPKGVLLVGPPGTGKTLIAKAVAGEAGVPFFSISGSEFVEMFVGVGAARVRDLFRTARRHAPCIVFVDEIDAVGRQRGTGLGGGNDEREQTLNQLLVEMDGFNSDTNIIVIAATNRADILDQALLRPGRFDRQVVLDRPDLHGRLAILRVHARGKPLAPDVDLQALARQTAGFSGADLANVLNEAAILAARASRTAITQADLDEAVLRVVAGPERRSRLITDREKAVIAYHEVGHALVMKALPDADPVTKVSCIARGRALGITVQAPKEDRYLMTRSQLMARIAAAMGGRAAEEIIFGEITTGAQQDIDQATQIAWRMVTEFGMSSLGTVNLRRRGEYGQLEHLSDSLATRIDQEVLALVEEGYQLARSILLRQKQKLIEIAEYLMQIETIDGDELDRLLGMPMPEGIARPAEPSPLPAPSAAEPACLHAPSPLRRFRRVLEPVAYVAAVAWHAAETLARGTRLAWKVGRLVMAPLRLRRRRVREAQLTLSQTSPSTSLSRASAAARAMSPRTPA